MEITPEILSIPPYLSTQWQNIVSMQATPETDSSFQLLVVCNHGIRVNIPHLDRISLDAIFTAHARYTNSRETVPQQQLLNFSNDIVGLLTPTLQHNPEQRDSPDLPFELLQKIHHIAKLLGFDNNEHLPKAEPHCNCHFCQITRAFQQPQLDKTLEETEDLLETSVTDEDLHFENWNIRPIGKDLYLVSNPLDVKESYSVFLGDPLGCTCGEKTCEHIRAVLNT